jgi:hypothetical protein
MNPAVFIGRWGFWALGKIGASAIPELVTLMDQQPAAASAWDRILASQAAYLSPTIDLWTLSSNRHIRRWPGMAAFCVRSEVQARANVWHRRLTAEFLGRTVPGMKVDLPLAELHFTAVFTRCGLAFIGCSHPDIHGRSTTESTKRRL